MKAADLRKSILQAAVQGKLVPQDKSDEPASELLKRIQAEKATLIKEGKLKKEKPLSPIMENETLYDLPDGWVWCRLTDICRHVTDGEHIKPLLSRDGIPLLTAKNIQEKFIDLSNVDHVSEKVACKSWQRCCPEKSDILICSRGTLGRNTIVDIDQPFCLMGTVILLKLSKLVNVTYINYALKSPEIQHYMNTICGATAVSALYIRDIKPLIFPLPPFVEQQRIVAKLDKLMALCDELEAAEKEQDALEKHLSEDLPKAILQSAVQGKLVPQDKNDEPASELLKRIQSEKAALIKAGKLKKEKPLPPITEDEVPYDLPEGWVWCRLGQLCQYGVTKNAAPSDIPEGAWVLELEDVEKDTGRVLAKRTTPHYKPQSTKHIFEKGDVLYSKLRPYLNKVLIAENSGYCTSEILPLHFSKEINTNYILFYFRSPLFVEYANSCSYGVKMPRLGTNDGQMALLPLPPFIEQERIVDKVNELMMLCKELKHVDMQPINYSKVVPFPSAIEATAEPVAMAARGDVNNLSAQARQAIEDLFAEDE